MNKILVISCHLDDETLGCGGTIIKHISNGDQVYWINATLPSNEDKHKLRLNQYNQIRNKYKFIETFLLGFDSISFDQVPNEKIINSLSIIIKKIEPNIIYLPNRSDVHSDHRKLFNNVYSCTKNFRYPFIKRVLMYETLSETEFAPSLPENVFMPNVFFDITEQFKEKIEIMKIYDSEIMEDYLPRSLNTIKTLARYRGSRISVKYAEAFMLLLEINQ